MTPFERRRVANAFGAVVDLPAGQVDGLRAGVGELEPVGGVRLSPLLQGETSETTNDGDAVASSATAVTLSVNGALVASGVPPTVGSSTATLTE